MFFLSYYRSMVQVPALPWGTCVPANSVSMSVVSSHMGSNLKASGNVRWMLLDALQNWPLPSPAPLKDTLLIREKALINGAFQSRLGAPGPALFIVFFK